MAFSEATTAILQTTDAEFRVWCQAVHDKLSAAGCVQTSDTGQINLSTVTVPATSTFAGYEIWRFNDADQSTVPVFFKIEYGKGSTATRIQIKVTVGTGSDGAGGISNASTAYTVSPTAAGVSTGHVLASLFDGELLLIVAPNNGSYDSCNFALGRSRVATDGTLVGAGNLFLASGGAGQSGQQRVAGAWQSATPTLNLPTASNVNSGTVLMGRCWLPYYPAQPLRCILGCPTTLSSGDSGNVTVDGVTCTYKKPMPTRWWQNTSGTDFVVRTA